MSINLLCRSLFMCPSVKSSQLAMERVTKTTAAAATAAAQPPGNPCLLLIPFPLHSIDRSSRCTFSLARAFFSAIWITFIPRSDYMSRLIRFTLHTILFWTVLSSSSSVWLDERSPNCAEIVGFHSTTNHCWSIPILSTIDRVDDRYNIEINSNCQLKLRLSVLCTH